MMTLWHLSFFFGIIALCSGQTLQLVGQSTQSDTGPDLRGGPISFAPTSERAFVVRGKEVVLDVFDVSDARSPKYETRLTFEDLPVRRMHDLAIYDDVLAVSFENDDRTGTGFVVLIDVDSLDRITVKETGVSCFGLSFSPNGRLLAVANSGEEDDEDFQSGNPRGSITFLRNDDRKRFSGNLDSNSMKVKNYFFDDDDSVLVDSETIIRNPLEPLSLDLEPLFLYFTPDNSRLYVSLGANNAIAELPIGDDDDYTVEIITGNGATTSGADFEFDGSDQDGAINIQAWPVLLLNGKEQFAFFEHDDETYGVFLNSGKAIRENPTRTVSELNLDDATFADQATLQSGAGIGPLEVFPIDSDDDGDVDQLWARGSRKVTIERMSDGEVVYDSGDSIEKRVAQNTPELFNGGEDGFDSESPVTGPTLDSVRVFDKQGVRILYVGSDNGGIFLFDITDPSNTVMTDYTNGADSSDRGSIISNIDCEYVPASQSTSGDALLCVGHHSNVFAYEITVDRLDLSSSSSAVRFTMNLIACLFALLAFL